MHGKVTFIRYTTSITDMVHTVLLSVSRGDYVCETGGGQEAKRAEDTHESSRGRNYSTQGPDK